MQLSVACIHVIIVACPHPMCCCIYTALVSLLFGTVIPTSFNILMEMFLHLLYISYTLYVGIGLTCILALKTNAAETQLDLQVFLWVRLLDRQFLWEMETHRESM